MKKNSSILLLTTLCAVAFAQQPVDQAANKAKIDAALAKIQGITNFNENVRELQNVICPAFPATLANNDIASLDKILNAIASDTNVTKTTFMIFWRGAANALVDDAIAKRQKPDEYKDSGIAGFRGAGSTFGLWQSALDIGGHTPLYEQRLAQAEKILTHVMPQQHLTSEILIERDLAILVFRDKVGSEKSCAEALQKLIDTCEKIAKLGNDADGALVRKAIDQIFVTLKKRKAWSESIVLTQDFEKRFANVFGSSSVTFLARRAAYHYLNGDSTQYDECYKKLCATPFSRELVAAFIDGFKVMRYDAVNSTRDAPIYFEAIMKYYDKFTLEQRFDATLLLNDCARLNRQHDKIKEYFEELTKIDAAIKENNKTEYEKKSMENKAGRQYQPKIIWRSLAGDQLSTLKNSSMMEHDYDPAITSCIKLIAGRKQETSYYMDLGVAYIQSGRYDEAVDILGSIVTNGAKSAKERIAAAVLSLSCTAKNPKQFKSEVMNLRSVSDAEKKDGEDAVTSDERFFNCLRNASWHLVDTCLIPERYEIIKAMQECSESMMHPEERVRNQALYIANAPLSADAALRSGIFDMKNAEHRFGKYMLFSSASKKSDLNRLISLPKPKLDDLPPEYEGTVVIAYDEAGLHIYMRFKDPKAAEARLRRVGGVGYELTLVPGEFSSYHQSFWGTFNNEDNAKVEWNSPEYGYRNTRDSVKNDSSISDKEYVCHTFYPWTLFYDKMPENGTVWSIVLCAGWGGQFRALGGGAVHEIGRGMFFTFNMDKSQRAAIRRGLALQAVSEYSSLRQKWSNVGFWADPHMGDELFYDDVVKTYIEKLDEIAKTITMKTNPAEIDAFLSTYGRDCCDFVLRMGDLRASWLKDKFFKE